MAVVPIQELLEAGVHFGHQTRKRNPKMIPFIFDAKNGIHIINLQKTQKLLDYASQFARTIAMKGEKILFVGTKPQIKESIHEEAEAVGQPYINERWLGGTLTNIKTIRQSIERLKKIEELNNSGVMAKLPKKEQSSLGRELVKLKKNLDGIKNLQEIPTAMLIVDTLKERNAVKEAKKLGIMIIAICDTNSDPSLVDFIIPGNDDAMSSVKLIVSTISKSIKEGNMYYEEVKKQQKVHNQKEKAQQKAEQPRKSRERSADLKKFQKELSAVATAASPETEN